ncbi:MAG: hypothetical protein JSS11_06010 [Verrucomicrobia bacterium]|nr:hypothetical protein [Verrucomicrobiota bacterium]
MKPSKTETGDGGLLTFATPALEFTVSTAYGPRVTALRSLRGKAGNLFLDLSGAPRYHGYYLRGGHRLWHSPEDIVRTYQPDDLPLDVKFLSEGVSLTQPVEEKTGLQKAIRLETPADRTVKVTHRLTNLGLWAVEAAPWALTMLRKGGYGVLPLLPKGDHAKGDLLPTYSLVPWSFTDLSLPVWQMHRNFIGIEVAKAKFAQKLGITNYPGWSAYWVDGTTFVKYAPVLRGATYPDFGSAFETFTNGAMIELETLGPIGPIAPGKTVTHVEYWTVLDGLPKPSTDKVFDGQLAPAVNAWIKTLK